MSSKVTIMAARYTQVTFDSERWFAHWEKIIDEIKSVKLNYEEIASIHEDLVHEVNSYGYLMFKKHQYLAELSTKLKIAFYRAHMNYRESQTGLRTFFVGLFADRCLSKLGLPKLPTKSDDHKK